MTATGTGWRCPACKRLVPGGVETCRCGGKRPAFVYTPPDDTEHAGSSSRTLPTTIMVLVLAGFGLYFWYQSRRSSTASTGEPVSTTTIAAPVRSAGDSSTAAAPARAMPPPGDVTPKAPGSEPASAPPAVVANAGASGSLEDMVAAAGPAVVLIETDSVRGTGFFVRSDLLVTNAHVVKGSTTVKLKFADGKTGSALVIAVAENVDLAILRPAAGSEGRTVLELSSIARVRPGQEVIAIGSALGLQNTVTRGIVSALRNDGGVMLLQTDAAINPGNSGGPLLDRAGRVVGVNTMKVGAASSIGFAVAADHVKTLVDNPSGAAAAPAGSGSQLIASAQRPSGLPSPPADDRHAEAVAAYEAQLKSTRPRADQIDDYWDRFKKSCNVSVPAGAGDRQWFGVWAQRPDMNAGIPDCSVWLADLVQLATGIRTTMTAADESARRGGVYPGEARDLRKKYRLAWDGWEK
jgi:S1-C subfamily serine protease